MHVDIGQVDFTNVCATNNMFITSVCFGINVLCLGM